MQIFNLNDYKKGWFIGNFEPTLLKTKFFEVSIQTYKKGEFVHPHTHKIATEYNVVIEGSMSVQGNLLKKNDILCHGK